MMWVYDGLLGDSYGFGRIGDHGGPRKRCSTRQDPLRLADIAREVSQIMQLPGER